MKPDIDKLKNSIKIVQDKINKNTKLLNTAVNHATSTFERFHCVAGSILLEEEVNQ